MADRKTNSQMSDLEAGNLIQSMLLGTAPRFTEQEISMMNTDMRTPAQKYQDSRLELAMMNANTGQKITRPRIAPRFAAEMADKAMREGYDPSPDVGSVRGVANNPVSQAAGNVGFAAQRFGKNIQQAGPIGLLAGLGIEDAGNRVQKAAYGESDFYDPAMIMLDATTVIPSMYMSRGMMSAMKDKDRNSMLWRQVFGE